MVLSRVSTALVTVGATSFSGISWRMTRTVTVARYIRGIAAITVRPMARGTMNDTMANHLRRLQTARSQSNVSDMCFRVDLSLLHHGGVTEGKTRTTPDHAST